MQISVVSSLTAEDESRLAPALMETIAEMLDLLRVAYAIRLETALNKPIERAGYPMPPAQGRWSRLRQPLMTPPAVNGDHEVATSAEPIPGASD